MNKPKIIELELHRSKKAPNWAYVIARLLPCDHRQCLGMAKWPKDKEGTFLRVNDTIIWEPSEVAIADKIPCNECPNPLLDRWVKDLPHDELLDEELDSKPFIPKNLRGPVL